MRNFFSLAAGTKAGNDPSWCLNLNPSGIPFHNRIPSTLERCRMFQSTYHAASQTSSRISINKDEPSCLYVSASYLDLVLGVTPPCPELPDQDPTSIDRHEALVMCSSQLRAWNKNASAWLLRFLQPLPFDTKLNILWRTLIADLTSGLAAEHCGRSDPSFLNHYRAWLTEWRIAEKTGENADSDARLKAVWD